MRIEHPSITIQKFSDLPKDLHKKFNELAKVAFEGIEKHEVIFRGESVPPHFIHFGFLDAVSALYGAGDVSYNFLHLTIQEFFAAYYISQLSGVEATALFERYASDKRWNIVWRFVAGLTKLVHLDIKSNSIMHLRAMMMVKCI